VKSEALRKHSVVTFLTRLENEFRAQGSKKRSQNQKGNAVAVAVAVTLSRETSGRELAKQPLRRGKLTDDFAASLSQEKGHRAREKL